MLIYSLPKSLRISKFAHKNALLIFSTFNPKAVFQTLSS